MSEGIYSLINASSKFLKSAVSNRANCFNAVKFYYADTDELAFLGPEEFVLYLNNEFEQVPLSTKPETGDVTVIWSRSNESLPLGQIQVLKLDKGADGYPFGLIIEHSLVRIDEESIFQKRDPSKSGPYEIIPYEEALEPYKNLKGHELTLHRKCRF